MADEGHTHGGEACSGHGHDHGHDHGAPEKVPLLPRALFTLETNSL